MGLTRRLLLLNFSRDKKPPSTFVITRYQLKAMKSIEQELSLSDIFSAVRARSGMVIWLTAICGALGMVLAFFLPPSYEATVVMAPVLDEADGSKLGGGAGALLSQFGGLAALGGIGLGGGGKKSEALATLQSAALTQTFIEENRLLPILFSSRWNTGMNAWKSSDVEDIPTLWDGELKFRKSIRSVIDDKKTGLITLTIRWRDPQLCADWAAEIVSRTNAYLRSKAIAQSNKNLAYLNDQLSKTSVIELQKAIYGLIEAEIKKIMIANATDEYAFRVIDPARVPQEKSGPKRSLIVLGTALAGLIIGVLLALGIYQKQN